MKQIIALCLCIAALCTLAHAEEAVILSDRVLVRQSPGGGVAAHLNAGDAVPVTGAVVHRAEDPSGGLWYRVESGGHTG